jgi:hypothetical protein
MRLERAGWHPGRDVWSVLKLPSGLDVFPEAKRILSEFGGLTVDNRDQSRLDLDPALGEEVMEEIEALCKRIGRPLFPLGAADGCDFMYLLIDNVGRLYILTNRLEPFASSFERALPWLVQGSMNTREWKEDLQAAGLFGKAWEIGAAGDPEA